MKASIYRAGSTEKIELLKEHTDSRTQVRICQTIRLI